jgi:hypothetical protein
MRLAGRKQGAAPGRKGAVERNIPSFGPQNGEFAGHAAIRLAKSAVNTGFLVAGGHNAK